MGTTPVYVKIDEFKDILGTLNTVKGKLNEANETLAQISELKAKEDQELEAWKQTLSEVADKVASLDNVLFEHE